MFSEENYLNHGLDLKYLRNFQIFTKVHWINRTGNPVFTMQN